MTHRWITRLHDRDVMHSPLSGRRAVLVGGVRSKPKVTTGCIERNVRSTVAGELGVRSKRDRRAEGEGEIGYVTRLLRLQAAGNHDGNRDAEEIPHISLPRAWEILQRRGEKRCSATAHPRPPALTSGPKWAGFLFPRHAALVPGKPSPLPRSILARKGES